MKEKLRNFEKTNVLITKTTKQLARINIKKDKELKGIRKKAYSNQHAFHVLKTKHAIPEDDLKIAQLGPTSSSDLRFLTMIKDRRMLYTILGINGEQLRDSKLVAEDVKKFLKRGQVEKAIFLARLAKKKGSAAMNAIMEYYFQDLGFSQSAVQMYNWRKKWQIPLNQYTHTILFNGLAQQKHHISKANGDMVSKIVDELIEKEELSQIEFNAALGALSNCTEVSSAFELYERKIEGVQRDAITFLYMIRACCRVKTDQFFGELLSGLMKNLPTRCVDSQLIFEYCKAISSRSENREIKKSTLAALCSYFDIPIDESKLPPSPEHLVLLPLSHWSINNKFKLTPNVIGLFLENCLEAEEYKMGIDFFMSLRNSNPKILDLGMHYNFMDLLTRNYPTSCGDKCLKVFEEMESNSQLISTKHSIILVYRALLKQASKKYVNAEKSRVENLLNACQGFIINQEGVYSDEFKERIVPFQSWKYFVSIWKEANSHDKMSTERVKLIIDAFSKSLCAGIFGVESKKRKDLENQRFIELEAVRLLKTFASRLELPNVENLDITAPSTERDIFLLRRLILRIKDKLLEHIKLIENNSIDEKAASELEWSLSQLAHKILSSELPPIGQEL